MGVLFSGDRLRLAAGVFGGVLSCATVVECALISERAAGEVRGSMVLRFVSIRGDSLGSCIERTICSGSSSVRGAVSWLQCSSMILPSWSSRIA